MSDELVFDDLTFKEKPVKIGDKDYVLRELNGDGLIKYESARMSRCTLGADGKPVSVSANIAEIYPLLVSLCLFSVNPENGQKTPVSIDFVKKLPGRIQTALFTHAKDISGIDQEVSEETKKSSSTVTEVGSN